MSRPTGDGRKPQRFLWQELGDGTAGAGIRLAISPAIGLLLFGGACGLCGLLSYLFPDPVYGYVPVRADVTAVTFLTASLVYIGALFVVWRGHRRKRPIGLAAAMTFGILLVAVLLTVGIAVGFRGGGEVLQSAVWSVSAAAMLLLWVHVWRRYTGGRALFAPDGQVDLRCPACGYRMIGLNEARCPECGEQYTLDELIVKQDFAVERPRWTGQEKKRPACEARPGNARRDEEMTG